MTGESKLMKKSPDTHHKEGSDCFLISGSKINDGNGLGLVLSVGINSQLGIMRAGMNTDIEPTPLQLKLDDLANTIGYVGTFGAGLTVVGCSIGHIISCISSEQSIFSLDSISVFLSFIVLGITIIVMAVPEGLPMAVTISLSFSVNKMAKLNSLVRDMSAVETMGGITDVCSDKTGTLTENSMTVRDVYYGGQSASVQGGINEQMKKDPVLIEMCEIGCINSTVTPDLSKPFKEQTGNKTDLAIVEFANRMGIAYTSYRPSPKIIKVIPFSSERKRMSCVYDKSGVKYLYIKGAPEVLVGLCSQSLEDGKLQRIDADWRTKFENTVLKVIGGKMSRGIGVAKVELPEDVTEDTDTSVFEKDLTFMGVFSIADPVRAVVPDQVKLCRGAGVTVRMVTGDNTLIGTAIAKECNILEKNYVYDPEDFAVMEGKRFREYVGDLQFKEEERDGKTVRIPYVGDMAKFQKIEPHLRVIGRCLPMDKMLLVVGLQAMGKVVSVTGDGANDAAALKRADVGLAMGKSGNDIAKDASKIILLDDNFKTIVTSVLYVSHCSSREETSSTASGSLSSSS
jgi:calcium-translocating P-type ATPase